MDNRKKRTDMKKIPLKQIETLPWTHHKTADGYTYEKDIYTPSQPVIIELNKNEEYHSYNEKTSEITITNHLPTNTYGITLTLTTGTQVTTTTKHLNEYQILLYP